MEKKIYVKINNDFNQKIDIYLSSISYQVFILLKNYRFYLQQYFNKKMKNNKILFTTTKKSYQQNKTQLLQQNQLLSKLILPKLNQNKKAGSVPIYPNINSGGDSVIKFKQEESTNASQRQTNKQKNKIEFPKLSAKSYLLFNFQKKSIIKSCAIKFKRQIASLTKMMTAISTIKICSKYRISPKQTFFRITQTAANVNGTLANLQPYQWMNINDLLYGLMLPSGNDAANVLAENLGAILYFDKIGQNQLIKQIKSIDLTEDNENIPTYLNQFIIYINEYAKQLQLKSSKFSNPHGLDHRNNYSTCQDVLKLSLHCIQNDYFKKIINTKSYKAEARIYRNKILYKKAIYWTNTNRLLGKSGYVGIKTGFTPEAGGCLSSLLEIEIENQKTLLLVIVLGSKSQQFRFIDTQNLVQWYFSTDSNIKDEKNKYQ